MLREPSIAETAKQRSLRVPLDFYKRPDRMARTKLVLTALAAGAAAVYVTWLLLGGRPAQRHVSPGPVASVHAAWNDDCQVCHKNFQPLRADAISLAGLFRGQAANRESLDASCLKCHHTPLHHSAAKPDEVPSCAACHREHQGRTGDIVRTADGTCLGCHREIDQHRHGPSGLTPQVANIGGFGLVSASGAGPHPDFRSLQNDPGNLKFNHWLHLQPGIAVADAKQKLKLNDLDEARRPHYAGYAKADQLIQLDCAACHQPDAAGGASMQPIAFEQHCRACHPLALNLAENKPADVPHGLSAARLREALDGLLFAAERGQSDPPQQSPDESGNLPLIPGKTLGNNLAQKIRHDMLGRRGLLADTVAAKCLQCHYPDKTRSSADAELLEFLPTSIPATWFEHARFAHGAHRHVDCRHCHADAYAFEERTKPRFITPRPGETTGGFAAARDDEQVMIAGLESCAKCHAPARGNTGGARHDCAECHAYHGGDAHLGRALSFPGSSLGTRYPEAPASPPIPDFLNIHFASFNAMDSRSSTFVGAASCASAGCHGDSRPDTPAWRSAFTTWANRDPHAQAYNVLWTYRAREMTRLLDPAGIRTEPLSDAAHFGMLQKRCLGCHATPAPDESQATADNYALGVHCESCHGAAGEWLHSHYRAGFQRDGSSGFVDTKDLTQRAATCLKCHVGSHSAMVVDHDLIAAGHPRLAFEFHSYLESLPAHWDRKSDEARRFGGHHFRSWLAGQTQQTEQLEQLAARQPLVDFAQLDCAACHHPLTAASWRQRASDTLLQPVRWPPSLLPSVGDEDLPLAARLKLAQSLLQVAADAPSHDAAVQSYLAVRAVAADIAPQSQPHATTEIAALRTELGKLGGYLATDCYRSAVQSGRQPTTYDSPANFAPATLIERLTSASGALRLLEIAIQQPTGR
jgi:Cytochrome c554 and c-prime